VGRVSVLVLALLATTASAAAAPQAPSRPDPAPAAASQATAVAPVSPGYRKGLEALRAGRLAQAEAAAMSILGAQPQQAGGRQLLGLVKVKKGDLPGAIGEFDKALVSDPQFIPAREERAVALARMGQPEKARTDLEVLKTRAAACAKTCPPELRTAVSRVEAALAAGRPAAALSAAAGLAHLGAATASNSF
jgi:tetratricopeptide (TPR) repeat protein